MVSFGSKGYTTAVDIWGLGCIAYELCTLTPPFNYTDFGPLNDAIRGSQPPPINSSSSSERYSEHLVSIIFSMLEKNPERRLTLNQFFADPVVRTFATIFRMDQHLPHIMATEHTIPPQISLTSVSTIPPLQAPIPHIAPSNIPISNTQTQQTVTTSISHPTSTVFPFALKCTSSSSLQRNIFTHDKQQQFEYLFISLHSTQSVQNLSLNQVCSYFLLVTVLYSFFFYLSFCLSRAFINCIFCIFFVLAYHCSCQKFQGK